MELPRQNIMEVLLIVGFVLSVTDGFIRVQSGYMMALPKRVVLDVTRRWFIVVNQMEMNRLKKPIQLANNDLKEEQSMNGVIKNITVCRIGLPVTANKRGEQFNLTEGRKYTVLGFDGDILIENDLGKKEFYSKEYFEEYEELYRQLS